MRGFRVNFTLNVGVSDFTGHVFCVFTFQTEKYHFEIDVTVYHTLTAQKVNEQILGEERKLLRRHLK